MQKKNFGFTLIELLVVIVIIGILATISTATFRGYFGDARDAIRQSAVDNIALMIKVDSADEELTPYDFADADLQAMIAANDYEMPSLTRNTDVYFGYLTSDATEFYVVMCNDASDGGFVSGTPDAVALVETMISTSCIEETTHAVISESTAGTFDARNVAGTLAVYTGGKIN
ncbi:type II secretion system protein [bacterium]|nr:type II secretion system protein [bacterium]MBT6831626.1 type II secretion system protein [bacterium]MBT6996271.1 type II secretion system protein [bacterium]MBT7772949.1 type II secretion system protein [bacterium]